MDKKDMETCCEPSLQFTNGDISKARTTTFCHFFWIEFMLHCLKDQKEPRKQRTNEFKFLNGLQVSQTFIQIISPVAPDSQKIQEITVVTI